MKRRLSQRLVLAAAVFLAISTFGRVAHSEDARVLPAGVGRFSFVYAETSGVNDQFDADGNRESITAPYNVELNAKTLKAADPNGMGALINSLNQVHPVLKTPAGDTLDLGTLNTSAQVMETQENVGFQYGITDRLTIGFNVPIVQVNTTLNASLTGTNTAQNLAADFAQPGLPTQVSPVGANLQKLAAANVEAIRELLQTAGYNVPQNTTQQGIGDIVFGGRYNYYRSHYENVLSSVQAGLSAPTGSIHDPSNPTQIDLGNGAWGIGVAHVFNYSPFHFLTLSNGLHYTHYLPASRNELVQDFGSESLLPPMSDKQDVTFQPGDRYEANLGADFHLNRAITLSGAYDWWWKKQDSYSGSDSNGNYGALSFWTNEYLESVQAGISVSSIEAFKRKSFPIPCDAAFNIYIPRVGRNAPIGPYGTLSLDLYI